MPIVDIAQPHSDFVVDTPKGFAITPGSFDVDHGSDAPSFGDVRDAAYRLGNTMSSTAADETRGVDNTPEPGFNSWQKIKGTDLEPYFDSFADAHNPQYFAAMERQIRRLQEDQKLVDSAPFYKSVPAQLEAGVFDLPTLLPGGAVIKGARGVKYLWSAANVAAWAGIGSAAQESVLHATQSTRTLSESGINVSASLLLGGVLGAGAAKLSQAEWNAAVRVLERDLANHSERAAAVVADGANAPASAGAAAVDPMNIEGNAIAGRAASAVAKATENLNPALRILQSPSAATREVGTRLFENSVYLKKNLEGVASEPAAETLMKEWNAGLARTITATDEGFLEHRRAGGQLTRSEFREAVGRAMRRGDEADDPHVARAAKEWRDQVFDPLKEAAIKAKLLPQDVNVETAASYFSRMWNRNRLVAREGEFKAIVHKWLADNFPKWAEAFDKETVAKAAKLEGDKLRDFHTERRIEREARFGDLKSAAKEIADEVFNSLTGRSTDGARPEFVKVKARGPLKERTFNIPDHLVEDFLESDVDLVGRRYTRVMGADVEIANKFGSVDMAEQIQKIRDDYARMRQGVTDEKQLAKLGKSEAADIRDIEALRDLLRGTRIESPVERGYGRIARIANMLNYIRSMGEVVLASLTDAIRPAWVHGLSEFMQTAPQLLRNANGIKLSVAEAQLAGNITERVLAHRLATISDIIDPYASRGPIEALLENGTNIASKWNGIRIWTDMMKSVAAVMTQNRILKGVENYASLPSKERAYLAYLGIDEKMAERIAARYKAHGEVVDGVRVANTEEWVAPAEAASRVVKVVDGKEVPAELPDSAVPKGRAESHDDIAIRAFRAAVNKDVDSIIVQKSVADVPLFASTPTGRMLLQFKSFALASHQRVLLRGLQEDQTRFIGGMIAMTAMGMLQAYLKALAGNRTEKQSSFFENPGWWIGEGLDRAGVLSVPMELSNAFEKMTGINPIKSPIKAFDQTSAISQKNQGRNIMGSIVGPTGGLIEDAATAGGIPMQIYKGEDVTQGQKSALERLIPYNSFAGARQMIRYLVNPPD